MTPKHYRMLPDRYNYENFKGAVREPKKLRSEFQRVTRTIEQKSKKKANRTFIRPIFEYKYDDPVDIVSEDWDNLIVLDSCRADYFEEHNPISGDMQTVISPASSSGGFMDNQFSGRDLDDIVYVTPNSYVEKGVENASFHVVETVWDDYEQRKEFYNPDLVFDAAMEMVRQYPDKRMIVHFMQPHGPYLGPKADALREKLGPNTDIPSAAQKGLITRDLLEEVYVENLELAFEYVEHLIDETDGKTIITADHGELLMDGKLTSPKGIGHPKQTYLKELRLVPWFKVAV